MCTNQAAASLRLLCLCLFDILSTRLVNDPFVNALIIFRGKDWLLFTANGLVSLCSYCFCTQPTACLFARRPCEGGCCGWEKEAARHHGKLTDWLPNVGNSLCAVDTTHMDRQATAKAHNHSILIDFTVFLICSGLKSIKKNCTNCLIHSLFGFRSMSLTLSGTHLQYFINGCVKA